MKLIENFFYNNNDLNGFKNDFLNDFYLIFKNEELEKTYEGIHYYDYNITFYPLIISIVLNAISIGTVHFNFDFYHRFYEGICWLLLVFSILLLILVYKLRFFSFFFDYLFTKNQNTNSLEENSINSNNNENLMMIKQRINELSKKNGKELSISSEELESDLLNSHQNSHQNLSENKLRIDEQTNSNIRYNFICRNKLVIYISVYLVNFSEVCFYHIIGFSYFNKDLGGGLAISIKLLWILIKKLNKKIYNNEFRYTLPSLCCSQLLSIIFDIFLTNKEKTYRFRTVFYFLSNLAEIIVIYIIDRNEKLRFLNSHEIRKKQDVLEGILNNLGSGLIICNLQKKILFSNNKADEFIGEDYYIINKNDEKKSFNTNNINVNVSKSNINFLEQNNQDASIQNLIPSNFKNDEIPRKSLNINNFQSKILLQRKTIGENDAPIKRVSSFTNEKSKRFHMPRKSLNSLNTFINSSNLNNSYLKDNSLNDSKGDIYLKENLFSNLEEINQYLPKEIIDSFQLINPENLFFDMKLIDKYNGYFKDFVYLGILKSKDRNTQLNNFYEISLKINSYSISNTSFIELFFKDISRYKEIEVEKAEIKTKTQLMAKIGHEFKNPLIVVGELVDQIQELVSDNLSMLIKEFSNEDNFVTNNIYKKSKTTNLFRNNHDGSNSESNLSIDNDYSKNNISKNSFDSKGFSSDSQIRLKNKIPRVKNSLDCKYRTVRLSNIIENDSQNNLELIKNKSSINSSNKNVIKFDIIGISKRSKSFLNSRKNNEKFFSKCLEKLKIRSDENLPFFEKELAKIENLKIENSRNLFKRKESKNSELSSNLIDYRQRFLNNFKDFQKNILYRLITVKSLSSYIISLVFDFDFLAKKESFTKICAKISEIDLRKEIKFIHELAVILMKKNSLNITFKSKIDEKIPNFIKTDLIRLRQILINLISNAIKFTNFGNIELHVEIKGENIEFKVTDTGQGIDNPELLFGKDTKMNLSKNNLYGSGLGLMIVKDLCDSIQANIKYEKNIPIGSKFIVLVPHNVEIGSTSQSLIDANDIKSMNSNESVVIDKTSINSENECNNNFTPEIHYLENKKVEVKEEKKRKSILKKSFTNQRNSDSKFILNLKCKSMMDTIEDICEEEMISPAFKMVKNYKNETSNIHQSHRNETNVDDKIFNNVESNRLKNFSKSAKKFLTLNFEDETKLINDIEHKDFFLYKNFNEHKIKNEDNSDYDNLQTNLDNKTLDDISKNTNISKPKNVKPHPIDLSLKSKFKKNSILSKKSDKKINFSDETYGEMNKRKNSELINSKNSSKSRKKTYARVGRKSELFLFEDLQNVVDLKDGYSVLKTSTNIPNLMEMEKEFCTPDKMKKQIKDKIQKQDSKLKNKNKKTNINNQSSQAKTDNINFKKKYDSELETFEKCDIFKNNFNYDQKQVSNHISTGISYKTIKITGEINENKKKTILIVDDESIIRQSSIKCIENYFKAKNISSEISFLEASDGIEALYCIYWSIVNNVYIDYIFTDDSMKIMNGYELIKIVQEFLDKSRIYKIDSFVVSAYQVSETQIKYPYKCVKHIFTKPLNKTMLNEINL